MLTFSRYGLHVSPASPCYLMTRWLPVTQNAALQKLCRSLRGAASSATAQREDPAASAPETARSVGMAEGAAAGASSNGALPQGASACRLHLRRLADVQ